MNRRNFLYSLGLFFLLPPFLARAKIKSSRLIVRNGWILKEDDI